MAARLKSRVSQSRAAVGIHAVYYVSQIRGLQDICGGYLILLQDVKQAGLKLKDLKSAQTSLENIFEQLLKESA